MQLRDAIVADAGSIARLHIASWRVAYRAELPAHFLDALDEPQRTVFWRERLEQGVQIALAERAGALAGFCAHGPARGMADLTSAWEIYALHVAPNLRGGGIGSALFEQAVTRARSDGAGCLTLWVLASNGAARSFYESRGMHADGFAKQRHLSPDVSVHEVRYISSLERT